MPEKLIEEYDVEMEGKPVHIRIVTEDHTKKYILVLPHVDVATAALLDDIKERLISGVEMKTSEIFEPKLMDELKKEFRDNASTLISAELPNIEEKTKDYFIQGLVNELLGLEQLEYLLADERLEEIVVNSSKEPVRVFHKKIGWLTTNINPASEGKILNYANTIARRVGREITTLSPLLDAHLMSKDRANAIISPIASKGNTITIRKFSRDPWTASDFIMNKTTSLDVTSLIWLVMQYEMNMIISGGTGSGKTSFLNICMPFIQPNQRIISIEDTRELQLPEFLFWCPLTTRDPNPEGKGEVSMLNLLVNSLRMRPDRIVMGEIRKQREAEVLFEAMHTGHSVYSTIHADTCEQTITRLTNPPIDIPHSMLDSVHLNVVMFRDRRRGIRRVFEVGEFIPDEEANTQGKIRYKSHLIHVWNARSDVIEEKDEPYRLFHELERHTGLTQKELSDDIETKKKVLQWMVDNKVRQVDDVGKVMNNYYMDLDTVLNVVNKNLKPEKLLS